MFNNKFINIKNNNNKFKVYITDKDSNYTVNKFFDIINNSVFIDDAKIYISKNYIDRINLNKLKNMFSNKKSYPFIIDINFNNVPKNCKKDTIFIVDENKNITNILHIYMLHEPDEFCNWKIYGIEEEN